MPQVTILNLQYAVSYLGNDYKPTPIPSDFQWFTVRNPREYVKYNELGVDQTTTYNSNPGLLPIPNQSQETQQVATGKTFKTKAPAASFSNAVFPENNETLYFAFTSLVNGVTGEVTTAATDGALSTVAGTSPIIQLNVYVPIVDYLDGAEIPGVIIDAFDKDTGSFISNNFFNVTSITSETGGESLAEATSMINTWGYTFTEQAQTIQAAVPSFQIGRVYTFDKWIQIAGGNNTAPAPLVINGSNFVVGIGSNVVAFAFFKSVYHSFIVKQRFNIK